MVQRQAHQGQDTRQGLAFAIAAYVLWGFLPLYLKMLDHIPAVEIVAHRIIWSVPIAAVVLLVLRRTSDLREALANRRMLGMACVTAALISVNWGIYVWAIASDRALEAAFGYYVNPLFSVFLGAVLLGERLSLAQILACGLACLAVMILAFDAGGVPWMALALTTSFGFYAFFKRTLPIGPNQGFLLEVLILSPFALAYMVWLAWSDQALFLGAPSDTILLLFAGVVTAVPLILYANGAKGLRLSSIGILQYIAPTMIFLIAVFVFGEEFGPARAIAFPVIWLAVLIYSVSMIRQMRK